MYIVAAYGPYMYTTMRPKPNERYTLFSPPYRMRPGTDRKPPMPVACCNG